MSAMDVSNLSREYMKKMFEAGKRFDLRKLDEFRKFEVTYDVSNKAEGSARVKLGNTEVIVGIKLSPGEPYPDSPEKGNLSVSTDLLPLASPRFEMGPPDFEGIELPRLIDREVRESKMIALDKLCIKQGEKVWTVFIDIYPINDDGNLIDAASIATLAALQNVVVPNLDENGKVDYEAKSKKKLPMNEDIQPLSFSFFKIGNSVILDPTREEQEACEARVTYGISKQGKEYFIHSCQKSGEVCFTKEDVAKMMSLLPKKYDEVMEKLKKFF